MAFQRKLTGMQRRVWRLVSLVVLALVTSSIAWWFARPKLIPIGQGRLAARMRGEGRPAVVFEAGLGGAFALYAQLQDRIADRTRTLVYDRAGFGRSDPGSAPRTAEQIARELRVLLGAVGIRPPVIFVCYTEGCLYTRVFAHDFPRETAGIVFIDPMTESFEERMRAATPEERNAAEARLPTAARLEQAALATTLAEAQKAWPLPQVPCIVITSLKSSGRWPFETKQDMDAWLKDNDALVGRLGGEATHIVLPQATHASVLGGKEVSKTILDMVQQVKEGIG
ncbi:MAG: alpha/beta fold hydrolase [Steroidobacteraceae bacterium]